MRAYEVIRKLWIWEFVGCLFSLACLGSIFAVLFNVDGRRLDEWHSIIPPNAIVSFIATLGKGSLIMVLSRILSQLKWLGFGDAQCLRQFKRFDSASRGPLGSLVLLWTSRKFLASAAALLMLITLVVDPFVQAVFSFPSKLVTDTDPAQQSMFSKGLFFDPYQGDAMFAEEIINGVHNGLTSASLHEAFTCPSGNCTWPENIKTLGVCGSCNNVTTEIQNRNCTTIVMDAPYINQTFCSYRFPSSDIGYTWGLSEMQNPPDGVPQGNVSFGYTIWNSTGSTDIDTVPGLEEPMQGTVEMLPQQVKDGSLVTFQVLRLPPVSTFTFEMPPAQGYECELHWCERTLQDVQVINGILSYTSTNQRLWYVQNIQTGVDGDDFYSYFFLPSQAIELQNSSSPDRMPYKVRDYSQLHDYLEQNILYFSFPPDNELQLPAEASRLLSSPDINATIAKLGDSLTEMIRTSDNSTKILGQTKILVSFMKVRWPWLTLPLVLLLATSILLTIVAIQSYSSRIAVWKDDPLAVLFHSVDGVDQSLLSNAFHTGSSDIKNLADEVIVKLSIDTPFTFVRSSLKS